MRRREAAEPGVPHDILGLIQNDTYPQRGRLEVDPARSSIAQLLIRIGSIDRVAAHLPAHPAKARPRQRSFKGLCRSLEVDPGFMTQHCFGICC